MGKNLNLGKVSRNDFKESRAASIARFYLEENGNIKTHFMEMDKTPNFDGKLMVLDGAFERITVEVQIKSLPQNAKIEENDIIAFHCDTKAMNCVLLNVTFNPVVLLIVDTEKCLLYYKLLTKEYVSNLKIGNQKTKKISLSNQDKFDEGKFIKEVYRQVKITVTDMECETKCGIIRRSIREAYKNLEEKFELVYIRGEIKGYFTTYQYICGKNSETFILSKIKMKYDKMEENLFIQYNKDYIHINRQPSGILEITDADISNIILEVAKEIKKPILYTNAGKPVYWYDSSSIWQLRAEEIYLDWYMKH